MEGELVAAIFARSAIRTRICECACDFWKGIRQLSRRTPKKLRLSESLPLGDRRFLAVIEFEGSRFLIGGTSNSLALLTRLKNSGESNCTSFSQDFAFGAKEEHC
jgi:hypothetical protein